MALLRAKRPQPLVVVREAAWQYPAVIASQDRIDCLRDLERRFEVLTRKAEGVRVRWVPLSANHRMFYHQTLRPCLVELVKAMNGVDPPYHWI